jgi:transposase-like protein
MDNDQEALKKMVVYCKHDVEVAETVYQKLQSYAAIKTHAGVAGGGEKYHCPQCGSVHTQRRGFRTSSVGDKRQIVSCNDCGRNFTVAKAVATKMIKDELRKAA